tara:strand:+ start:4710 stop:5432 length:723 start_codon:yes stop_codon:yes gene_type:complete
MANYPNTIQVGDIKKLDTSTLPEIGLLIGGSPCQDLSRAAIRGEGLKGSKSSLFYEYLRVFREVNPRYFLLENVKCKPRDAEIISEALGVPHIEINSSLVSAQNRVRYYWTSIPLSGVPEDKGIKLRDIVKQDRKWIPMLPWTQKEWGGKKKMHMLRKLTSDKSFCLTTNKTHSKNYYLSEDETLLTKLDADEAEILQTVPSGYTDYVAETHRFRMLGNGWTIDVVSHILGYLSSNGGEK